MTLRMTLALFLMSAFGSMATAQNQAPPRTLMCVPGELIFSEDFDPETVSDRWGFKADFALRDGALLRTTVAPTENKRVFLKDPSFHNTVIQFDFKLSGQTTDLRLVTGSGGHYNSVTQIHTDHFQVNTAADRSAVIVPSQIGECIRTPKPDQWQTMTVEYWNDEVVSHIADNEFVFGKHPIIDRARQYFAFQFDLPGASIDNVRVWKATGQRDDWTPTRKKLATIQTNRQPVKHNASERYKIEYTNLKSRLTLTDKTYRDLVARRASLEAALHKDYAEAFKSHKQLSKSIATKKKHLKATDPEFKRMETAVNKSRRAEDVYVLSTKPQLAELKQNGIPKQRFTSELGQLRAELETAGDAKLATLVAETAKLQAVLKDQFPSAFQTIDRAVEKRQLARKALNDDPEFQARNKIVVAAGKAIKEYERNAHPGLAKLAAEAKAYVDARK